MEKEKSVEEIVQTQHVKPFGDEELVAITPTCFGTQKNVPFPAKNVRTFFGHVCSLFIKKKRKKQTREGGDTKKSLAIDMNLPFFVTER